MMKKISPLYLNLIGQVSPLSKQAILMRHTTTEQSNP